MPLANIRDIARQGINRDSPIHELPENIWTDGRNIRFQDGAAIRAPGYSIAFDELSEPPQYLLPVTIGDNHHWIYAGADAIYDVYASGGSFVHTDVSHASGRSGKANLWTGCVLGGVPVLNAGDGQLPMAWDTNLANNFIDLPNFPASTACRSIRCFRQLLIAMDVTKSGTRFPYMVKWSHPADPGAVPPSWDNTDPTYNAGEIDIAEGTDRVVDGLQLRDVFIVYKERSVWRMSYIGGDNLFRFDRISGSVGILNTNCVAEVNGIHYVLGESDIYANDGQNIRSLLHRRLRRYVYNLIDSDQSDRAFVFVNFFRKEVCFAFSEDGSPYCNAMVVYNYADDTASIRELPAVHHATQGVYSEANNPTWETIGNTWQFISDTWAGTSATSDRNSVIMAAAPPGVTNGQLYKLDGAGDYDGVLINTPQFLERKGLTLGSPESVKLVLGVRPRISGSVGTTVVISIGYHNELDEEPTYPADGVTTFTIGSTIRSFVLISGRYIAVKFETGTSDDWRLQDYDIEYQLKGLWD